MNNLIINLAPTGMIPTKEMTRLVPISPAEIIADVAACASAGAAIAHVHARDEDGIPTHRREVFQQIIEGIRQASPDIIIAVTTSGRTYQEFEKRTEALELDGDAKPDMASLTLGSINFNKIASINSPDMIMRLAGKMREKGIKPELEVFDLGMVNFAHYLIKKDLLTPPYYFNIILGNIAAAQATLLHLGLIVSELPADSIWSISGIGDFQKPMNTIGIVMADGVRVGLEDNIWFNERRSLHATNHGLVQRIVDIATVLERGVAGPLETRQRLRLAR